ncbi:hypothetical protein Y032_0383g378, partial [Ancylostoma ceylanicum]
MTIVERYTWRSRREQAPRLGACLMRPITKLDSAALSWHDALRSDLTMRSFKVFHSLAGVRLLRGARRAMDALVSRARRIGPLRSLSDPLLLALFANSDCIPDRVQQGVVLFNKGDRTSYWYLLLAGEVQLFLPGYYSTLESVPLCSLSAGSLFGELDIDRHCCSAIVTRQAEFVRISQRHFVSLYN